MIDVLRRAEHFEIETGPALAPEVNRVALIKIDAPRGQLRLPTKPVALESELGVRALRIIATQTLDRRRVAVGNRHDARLLRPEIDLKRKLIIFSIAIQFVGLRRQLDSLMSACVFF